MFLLGKGWAPNFSYPIVPKINVRDCLTGFILTEVEDLKTIV